MEFSKLLRNIFIFNTVLPSLSSQGYPQTTGQFNPLVNSTVTSPDTTPRSDNTTLRNQLNRQAYQEQMQPDSETEREREGYINSALF